MEEIILVDTNDRPVGASNKYEAHVRPLLHRAFSIFIYNGKFMLLQKRHRQKYHSGGLWSNSCCSHQRVDETLAKASVRCLQEELRMYVPLTELFSFIYFHKFSNNLFEYEYDRVLCGQYSGMPIFNPKEIEEIRWINFSDLRLELLRSPEQFSVWFLSAAPKVLNMLEKHAS